MIRKIIIGLCLLSLSPFCIGAQNKEKSHRQSFDEFRKGILNDYQDFRKTILEHYADFLDGEWHPYESYNGKKKYSEPKPTSEPVVENYKPSRRPRQKPALTDETISGKPESKPVALPEEPVVDKHPAIQPAPEGNVTEAPEQKVKEAPVDEFKFFEIPMTLPQIRFNISDALHSTADYASHWRMLDNNHVASKVLPAIKDKARELGLNDYLTIEFIRSYIDGVFSESDESARLSTVHYLLTHLGYDARIACTGKGTPLLLIPFKQTVYGRSFMMVDGRRYYVFAPPGVDILKMSEPIYTCQLPAIATSGKDFDLIINGLNLPEKPKPFEFSYGDLHLTGEVNENLIPVLYRYPQMPTEDYARSNVSPELRKSLVKQVSEQLAGKNGDSGAESLLKFMHNVFEYATDDDYHGFEKPYFIEETLYYPKNDCEDRAIFYTYFLWNALGKESQLIAFPGHEAASVMLDTPINGASYEYKGKKFFISDPTYIGSRTGMVMPSYKNTAPEVDYYYH